MTPSAYGFRREPRHGVLLDIEAIHHVIELFNYGDAAKLGRAVTTACSKPFTHWLPGNSAYTPS